MSQTDGNKISNAQINTKDQATTKMYNNSVITWMPSIRPSTEMDAKVRAITQIIL